MRGDVYQGSLWGEDAAVFGGLLQIGGSLLGVLVGTLGMATLAFGFGAVHVGLGQLCASTNSDGRLIAFALAAGEAFSLIDAAVWMLSGAGLMATGGRAQLTHDGVTERSRERSHFLIVRQGAKDADVLILRLPDGQTALPVFGLEEEAGMFLWLETSGEGWCVAEISEADLGTLLRDSCAGVRRIVHPFAAKGVEKGVVATVDREDFLRTLSGERSCRGEEAGPKAPSRISAWVGEGFW